MTIRELFQELSKYDPEMAICIQIATEEEFLLHETEDFKVFPICVHRVSICIEPPEIYNQTGESI